MSRMVGCDFGLTLRSCSFIGQRFAAALLPRLFEKNPRSHHQGATGPLVGFELETKGFQSYAIANLDKTSL